MKNKKSTIVENQGLYLDQKIKLRKKILDLYITKGISRNCAIKRIDVSEIQFKRILVRYKQE